MTLLLRCIDSWPRSPATLGVDGIHHGRGATYTAEDVVQNLLLNLVVGGLDVKLDPAHRTEGGTN